MQKRPSPEQVKKTLLSQSYTVHPEESDVLFPMTERVLVNLPISEIDTYDKNPRRTENPNFSKIKESISKDGLNQPLVVTRRPRQNRFIVYKGGNTRLKAISELYEETGDPRYRYVDCSFIPWSGFESDAIIGHLQENSMRKSLCFIDRAYGVRNAIEHLQSESGEDEDLSIRDCHSILVEKGYAISLSSLSIMLYAASTIEPCLPSTVCASMGRPQIQKLRKLHKAFERVCNEFGYLEKQINHLFIQTLQSYAETKWNYRTFRRLLESELSNQESTSIQDVSLRIDGYLYLSSKPLNETFDKIYENLEKEEQRLKKKNSGTKIQNIENSETQQYVDSKHGDDEFKSIPLGLDASPGSSHSGLTVPKKTKKKLLRPKPQRSELETKLCTLRSGAFAAASRLAKRHGFYVNPTTKRNIVSNTGDWGIGYLVVDYPPIVEQKNTSEIAIRDSLWWLLLEYCDLQWASECARPLTAKLIGTTDLINFIKSGDPKTIISHAKGKMKCTFPHLGLISFCHRQLSEDSWRDLYDLTEIYRNIHQLANCNNIHLFQVPDIGGKGL